MKLFITLIAAIILPPLGALIQEGLSKHFLLNILLTLFGYFPGLIHVFYLIFRDTE